MHQTPWTKKDSSFPSDRIRPSYPAPQFKSAKLQKSAREAPKSKDVQILESLLQGFKGYKESQKDPKGGCFCQARVHSLSSYVPICKQCGLILCALNLPYYSCPHCASSLFTAAALTSLISRAEEQLDRTIAREEEEKERAIDEARKAAGAFPSLGSSPVSGAADLRPSQHTHKVLSLNSKTKRVTVSSYSENTARSLPQSSISLKEQDEDEEPVRVSAPPKEVACVKRKTDPERPCANLNGDGPIYVGTSQRHKDRNKK